MAAGVVTVFLGSVSTLATLEDSIYEKYYKSEVEFKITQNKYFNSAKVELNQPCCEELEIAEANLKAAEHSKEMINSVTSTIKALIDDAFCYFKLFLFLAVLHWFFYKFKSGKSESNLKSDE